MQRLQKERKKQTKKRRKNTYDKTLKKKKKKRQFLSPQINSGTSQQNSVATFS